MCVERSLLLVLVLGLATAASADETAREKQRRELLQKLGIDPDAAPPKKKTPPPDAPADGEDGADEGAEPGHDPDEAAPPGGPKGPPEKAAPARVPFAPDVHRLITQRCGKCHRPGKKGAAAGLVLTGAAGADETALVAYADAPSPSASSLYRAAAHDGGVHKRAPLKSDKERALLRSWLAGVRPRAPKAPAPAASPPRATSSAPRASSDPGAAAPAEPAAPPAPPPDNAAAPVAAGPVPAPAEAPAATPFVPAIDALLRRGCLECHGPGEMGADSGYVVAPDPAAHHASALRFVVPGRADKSRLWSAALGIDHDGDMVFSPSSDEAAQLARWIADGAHFTAPVPRDDDHGAASAGASVPPAPPAGGTAPAGAAPLVSPQPILEALGTLSPWLAGMSLHGRFDLSYERRGFRNHPLGEGEDVFRSYHHFIYFGRHTDTDPFGLDVELTSLQFWTLSAQLTRPHLFVRGQVGKLLVPFGADPVVHNGYGGLAGFDQRVLPVVWAQEGLAVSGGTQWGIASAQADLYLVRGHRLRDADSVLNLQSDLSPVEDIEPAVGLRLSGAVGPFRAFYSAYVNPLGEEQRLFLQALDVGFYRWQRLPVLRDVAVSLGVLRGDVTGRGPGHEYFHFGSYAQFRYYLLDTVYMQYRQGLRTFDNRRGLFYDETRPTADDASTHSVALVGTYRGLTLGIWQFWNFEKVDEVDDDFLRVTVGYAF